MAKFLVGNYQTGLETDLRPWLLPNDAFPELEDAYIFRGRIKKRPGYRFLGRLMDNIGNIMNLPVTGLGQRDLSNPQNINFEELFAFNQEKANRFDVGIQLFVDTTSFISNGTIFSWTGTDADFFWTTNYTSSFWATNNIVGYHISTTAITFGDGIRWFGTNTALGAPTGWANFTPPLRGEAVADPTAFRLQTALIVIPYKNRLVCLNTFEGQNGAAVHQPQRARWSQNGTPFYDTPVPNNEIAQANAWQDDIAGKGGFIDAPTGEQIMSAEFVKDSLIVFFERSTWRLAYTGNELLPFIWEQINTELGAESTQSAVPFDNGVLAVVDKGVVSANANFVNRIDEKIPDQVFQIQNKNQGPQRVHGQRDYQRELVYWTYPVFVAPTEYSPRTFPNKLLIYNYLNNSFSIWSGFFTTLGYFTEKSDQIWATSTFAWNGTNFSWIAGLNQERFPSIIGGNQQGFVHVFDDDINTDNYYFITAITNAVQARVTSPNHNLALNDVVEFDGVVGMTQINGLRGAVINIVDANNFDVDIDSSAFGAYVSGGFLRFIHGFNILTKRFNPFIQEDKSVNIPFVDFYVDRTSAGEFSVDVYADQNNSTMFPNLFVDTPAGRFTYSPTFIMSTQASDTLQGFINQDSIWVRLYSDVNGQFIQYRLYLTTDQKKNEDVGNAVFILHGMIINAEPHGRLI